MTKGKCEDIVDHYDDKYESGRPYQEAARDEVAVDQVRYNYAQQQQDRNQRRIHQEAFSQLPIHQQLQGTLSPAKRAVDTEKLFIGAGQHI